MKTSTKRQSTLTKRVWHDGRPPHQGWWNASIAMSKEAWRWWNGRGWSCVAHEHHSAEQAAIRAQRPPAGGSHGISWSDYYPKNARVPRVDPRQGKSAKRPAL